MTSHTALLYIKAMKGKNVILNPLLDATLLCIEGVASIVRGENPFEAQNSNILSQSVSENSDEKSGSLELDSESSKVSGMDMDYPPTTIDDIKDLLTEDQYLCTGLDLYVTVEPDLFASMALVHSRIRRVYYLRPCEYQGSLGTTRHIHSLSSLNHHFRVFKVIEKTIP